MSDPNVQPDDSPAPVPPAPDPIDQMIDAGVKLYLARGKRAKLEPWQTPKPPSEIHIAQVDVQPRSAVASAIVAQDVVSAGDPTTVDFIGFAADDLAVAVKPEDLRWDDTESLRLNAHVPFDADGVPVKYTRLFQAAGRFYITTNPVQAGETRSPVLWEISPVAARFLYKRSGLPHVWALHELPEAKRLAAPSTAEPDPNAGASADGAGGPKTGTQRAQAHRKRTEKGQVPLLLEAELDRLVSVGEWGKRDLDICMGAGIGRSQFYALIKSNDIIKGKLSKYRRLAAGRGPVKTKEK